MRVGASGKRAASEETDTELLRRWGARHERRIKVGRRTPGIFHQPVGAMRNGTLSLGCQYRRP